MDALACKDIRYILITKVNEYVLFFFLLDMRCPMYYTESLKPLNKYTKTQFHHLIRPRVNCVEGQTMPPSFEG